MYYIYKFLDKNNNILYIGRTNDLIRRLYHHDHLPQECYDKINKIFYFEINQELESKILESYFINFYKPIFNRKLELIKKIAFIKNIDNISWKEIDLTQYHFKFKYREKNKTEKLTKEEIHKKQCEGVQKAREEGHGGRKSKMTDLKKFERLCKEYREGKRTAQSIYSEFNITNTTFYRWLKKYNF